MEAKQFWKLSTLEYVSSPLKGKGRFHWWWVYRGYSNVWSEYDFYFIGWSEKMYISWVPKARMKYPFFFPSRDEIKVIFTTNIWIFFLLYISLSIEEMQILHLKGEVDIDAMTFMFCLVMLDMTSETLSYTRSLFWSYFYCNRIECAPKGRKFFHFRAHSFSEERQTNFETAISSESVSIPLSLL